MIPRRVFIKILTRFLTGMVVFLTPIFSLVRTAFAETKKIILPPDTDMAGLKDMNPATLDASNLEITPLKDFGVMGLTDHPVDLKKWRLQVTGAVNNPLEFSYSRLLELPAIERKVLLICPGFFTNHGHWKGISITTLLKMAEANEGITHVTLRGPEGRYEKTERFSLADVRSNKVFLAYQVNGQALAQKHGFPLRAVAEDHYGSQWVKFVYKIEALKVDA